MLLGIAVAAFGLLASADTALAAEATRTVTPIYVFGIPVDFILFGLTLLGVALFHHHTLYVALTGLAAITLYKLIFTGFKFGAGLAGFALHMQHEWVILANLFLLLMGFALLSRHFEQSRVPDAMPAYLPDDWKGGVALLADRVRAVELPRQYRGGADRRHHGAPCVPRQGPHRLPRRDRRGLERRRLRQRRRRHHDHHDVDRRRQSACRWSRPMSLLIVALCVLRHPGGAPAASLFADRAGSAASASRSSGSALAIVAAILVAAILANVIANLRFPALLDLIPVIGLAVWVVILAAAPLRQPDWAVMPETFKGTIFLLALVTCASLMPVEELPVASWQTALGLGFLSAVFDNIPLTALALKQGGYDWGYLAYTVGFGGSMIWFGSSAGVALSNMYPEAKSVGLWLRHGWHIAIAYVIGFFVMLAILGWKPDADHRKRTDLPNATPVVAMVVAASR